jgi:hypothetical protein
MHVNSLKQDFETSKSGEEMYLGRLGENTMLVFSI